MSTEKREKGLKKSPLFKWLAVFKCYHLWNSIHSQLRVRNSGSGFQGLSISLVKSNTAQNWSVHDLVRVSLTRCQTNTGIVNGSYSWLLLLTTKFNRSQLEWLEIWVYKYSARNSDSFFTEIFILSYHMRHPGRLKGKSQTINVLWK